MEFTGFSPETIDFLWGLRMNNNREWFLANKQAYQDTLYEPLKALSAALFAPFANTPNLICRTSRIYRDARRPHPDGPYKQSLWTCLRPDADDWSRAPTLFFEIRPDGYGYGFLHWRPRADTMAKFREKLDREPEKFLAIVKQIEKTTEIRVAGEEYYRKKICQNPNAAAYYNLKNFMAYVEKPTDAALFSPALADSVRQTLTALLPLMTYCTHLDD